MDILNFLRKKQNCRFCKKKGDNLRFLPKWGIYEGTEEPYGYHKECLEKVLSDPEQYYDDIDLAIFIADRLLADKRNEERTLTRKAQKIGDAQEKYREFKHLLSTMN